MFSLLVWFFILQRVRKGQTTTTCRDERRIGSEGAWTVGPPSAAFSREIWGCGPTFGIHRQVNTPSARTWNTLWLTGLDQLGPLLLSLLLSAHQPRIQPWQTLSGPHLLTDESS
jgi:hypothetical protein